MPKLCAHFVLFTSFPHILDSWDRNMLKACALLTGWMSHFNTQKLGLAKAKQLAAHQVRDLFSFEFTLKAEEPSRSCTATVSELILSLKQRWATGIVWSQFPCRDRHVPWEGVLHLLGRDLHSCCFSGLRQPFIVLLHPDNYGLVRRVTGRVAFWFRLENPVCLCLDGY